MDETLVSAEGSVHLVKSNIPDVPVVPVVADVIDPGVPDFKEAKSSSPANSQSKNLSA